MQPIHRTFKAGDFIFHEGTPSDSLYLVKKGTLSVRKKRGAAYVELARIYANEVIGELAFFDRSPRSASIVATNDVELLELSFDSLDSIYKNVPDYLKTIMASVADRLRNANETIRRLQKNVIFETGAVEQVAEGVDPARPAVPLSAAEVLAASHNVTEVATVLPVNPLIDQASPKKTESNEGESE